MASIIKADNIQKVSDGSNIIKKCGSTITLGSCGATISLACGATQTGFGRTGTVDWCTTAKTAPFTGVSGNGYFVNTTCGAVTVTLPATPTAGDIVAIKDYANTADTNEITIARNGSNICGQTENPNIANEGGSITLVYVDATKEWLTVDAAQKSDIIFPTYIVATGGTITCCGDYKIHTFTSDGTFCVSSISNAPANNEISYIVVAGGGAGAKGHGGGGGAGGFRENKSGVDTYTASPLNGSTPITVTATGFPITVGAGGAGAPGTGNCSPYVQTSGSNSVFSTITSAGGGKGGGWCSQAGANGGSGGGGGGPSSPTTTGYSGNTPPTSPPQGSNGGNGNDPGAGGGGGGATAVGGNANNPGPNANGGAGGAGATTSIDATPTAFAGGGGGGNYFSPGVGGAGGTGGGGAGATVPADNAVAGTANTGGGGGGGGANYTKGAAGGSGIVIIRYKYQ